VAAVNGTVGSGGRRAAQRAQTQPEHVRMQAQRPACLLPDACFKLPDTRRPGGVHLALSPSAHTSAAHDSTDMLLRWVQASRVVSYAYATLRYAYATLRYGRA